MENNGLTCVLLGCIIILVVENQGFKFPPFYCIQQNNFDSMKCVWESRNASCWNLHYSLTSRRHNKNWSCPVDVAKDGKVSCTLVLGDDGGYIQFEEYKFILTDCNGRSPPKEYYISTATDEFVRMDPVSDLRVNSITSSSVTIVWNLPMSPSSTHETNRIDCRATPSPNTVHNGTHPLETSAGLDTNGTMALNLTKLDPLTSYHIDVICKVAKSVIWSDVRSVEFFTHCKEPDRGPQLSNWTFTAYECLHGSKTICIIIYWTDENQIPGVCAIRSYYIRLRSADGYVDLNRTSDFLSAAFILPYDSQDLFTVDVFPVTTDGMSSLSSTMYLSTFDIQGIITSIEVQVMKQSNTTYNISWSSSTRLDTIDKLYYYFCQGQRLDKYGIVCKQNFRWEIGQTNERWRTLNVTSSSSGKLSETYPFFGVSLFSNGKQMGIIWSTCSIYVEDNYCKDEKMTRVYASKDGTHINWVVISPTMAAAIVLLSIFCCVVHIHRSKSKYDVTIDVPDVRNATNSTLQDVESAT